MTNSNTLKYRVGQLEKKYDQLDEKLDEILQNHLPHILSEQMAMKTRMYVLTSVNVAAVIIAMIVSKLVF